MSKENRRDAFDALFASVSPDDAKAIDDSVLRIIDHVHSRVSYTEEKRKSAIEVALGLITFSGPLLILLYQYAIEMFYIFTPFLLGLLGVGFLDLVLYIRQETFKRPFIETARTWRWFYHYCIKPDVPVGPFLFHDKEKREQNIEGYLEGLIHYASNTLKATPQRLLAQDIEQLFLLLMTEKLKNEHLKQQLRLLSYGFLTSLAVLIVNGLLITVLPCQLGIQENATLAVGSCSLGSITISVAYAIGLSMAGFLIILVILFRRLVFRPTTSRKDWDYLPP